MENKSRKASANKYNTMQLCLRLCLDTANTITTTHVPLTRVFHVAKSKFIEMRCVFHPQGAYEALKKNAQCKSCEFKFYSRTLLRTIIWETAPR